MFRRMKCAFFACLLLTAASAGKSQGENIEEWNSSDRPVVSKAGRKALEMSPERWQHLQSLHLVLHCTHREVGIRSAQEAEFYLAEISKGFQLNLGDLKHASHIFIFEQETDWKEFTKRVVVDPWTGGFFDGTDLFYWRKTGLGVLHSDSTLPHELGHRVFYERFPAGTVPLALNEGFAEYHARRLAFRYLRPRGYDVRVISKRVPRDKYIPVLKLLSLSRYPEEEGNVTAFYDESERLVNFLSEAHSAGKFNELLQALARGEAMADAFAKIYARDYVSLQDFEQAFEKYAVLETNK